MERNLQKNGLINVVVLLLIGVAGFILARYANSLAGLVSVIFISVGLLVAAVSWFQMRLEESERLERLELDELARGHTGSALFESRDSEMFPAQRSREQFERFFVPIFTALLCIGQAAAAFLLWRWLSQPALPVDLKEPKAAMFFFGTVFLTLFVLGRFSANRARLENDRLLRPGASYMLLNAWLSLGVAVGTVFVAGGALRADFYVARGLCVLLALTAVETLVMLLLEMYRPRVKGKVERPLYESRLVGLLGQPEGLVTTAAQALDYQFGFKVSETWFYRLFVEKALAVLVCLQIAVLFLSTCVVFIEAGEQGLLERCGRHISPPLEPGAHLKLPWPLDHVYRFRTQQIQSFEIGTTPESINETNRIILWTVAHTTPGTKGEDNFLVANREPVSANLSDTNNTVASPSRRTPPVSLVTGSIPVQYQITDLAAWAYNNEDAPSLLEDLATREVVRYLVGADMNEIMSYGRLEAAQQLRERIQAAADSQKLGAKVVSVGLQDLHPPVKVAPDYEKVIGAIQSKAAKILAARAEEIKTNALAEAKATNVINVASANRMQREIDALAQAALFTNQIPAYQAAPSVYVQRAYLQAFANSTASARKYILLTTNTHDVLQFDLQDKIRADILTDVGVQPAKK
jgi:regulator of protease activity HflC (stomatin/prohibitin superfamily)